jgi:hypothetical protein
LVKLIALTLPESIVVKLAGQRSCRTMAFFKLAKPMISKKIMVMLTWLKVSKKPSKKLLYNNRVKAKIFLNKSEISRKRAVLASQRRLNPRRTRKRTPKLMLQTKRESPV